MYLIITYTCIPPPVLTSHLIGKHISLIILTQFKRFLSVQVLTITISSVATVDTVLLIVQSYKLLYTLAMQAGSINNVIIITIIMSMYRVQYTTIPTDNNNNTLAL